MPVPKLAPDASKEDFQKAVNQLQLPFHPPYPSCISRNHFI